MENDAQKISVDNERPPNRLLINLALLTFPARGTVIFVGLMATLPQSLHQYVPESLPLLIGLLAPLPGTIPIFGSDNIPLAIKILFAVPGYYIAALLTIFVVGWITADLLRL